MLYNNHTQAKCTASIISPTWLITSYSCLLSGGEEDQINSLTNESVKDWKMFAERTVIDLKDSDNSTIQRQIQKIIPYSGVKYLFI